MDDPPTRADAETPPWLRLLQDWRTFAWPVMAAALAGLFFFAGYAAYKGKTSALGIYAIDRPLVTQQYFEVGAQAVSTLLLQAIILVIAAIALRAAGRWLILHLPDRFQAGLGANLRRPFWGWIVLCAAVLIAVFGRKMIADLMQSADGMILKPTNEIGAPWTRMSLDESGLWQNGYSFLLAAFFAVFVLLSWWIFMRFLVNRFAKVLYTIFACIQVLSLLGGFAFVYGVADTFRPFPIATFSNMEELGAKGALPVLLDSDDKLYAFLVVFNVGSDENDASGPSKVILYVPRTEIKWISVEAQSPLYGIAYYHDLKRQTPRNSAPSPPRQLGPALK